MSCLTSLKMFFTEVPEDGYVEGGTKKRCNHLIHPFNPNIDAMEKQEQFHPDKITLEVLHVRDFYCLIALQWLICLLSKLFQEKT